MPIPRYIATLALMPKSALNKYWRYIEGALYLSLVEAIYLELQWLISVCVGLDQYAPMRQMLFPQGGKYSFVETFRLALQ